MRLSVLFNITIAKGDMILMTAKEYNRVANLTDSQWSDMNSLSKRYLPAVAKVTEAILRKERE